ncbi:glycosyltransferase family 4 protein [Nakamurella endophytica]|uniref:glycosyltransferase family 4 protein n=1 Tax=Nakamurella endophytica TaxID=1748367 RepID=UPI0016668C01
MLLDATAIPADRGGVGRYVDGLVGGLDRIGFPVTVACQPHDADVFTALAPGARVVPVPARLRSRPLRLAWEQTGLPVLARRLRVDVVHSPHYTVPVAAGRPVVVTLHDATFFTDPALHGGLKQRFFRTWTRVALHRAAVAVVPSAATVAELERCAGADPQRLAVAHHGVDLSRFHVPDAAGRAAVADRLGLGDRRWIAFLGTLEPRKNVPELVRGYVRACAGTDDPPALVLAGAAGWDEAIDAAVAAVPAELAVLRPGHLPAGLLPGLLGGAELVAYPSLGEGFGLPVLEAMACGAAVLTTRRLALPEVGGDAVRYVEVDAGSIADGIAALLASPGERARLGDAARARAAGFTWEATARVHRDAYRRAAGTDRSRA